MRDPASVNEQLTLAETVLYGGERQWRLARIEVVNWGTFNGHHILDVSRKGLLITGRSGSGKSTLLDAISAVLTPPGQLHLNAAAKSDTSRGEDRTLVSYIRGAYGRSADELGEVDNKYLRPNAATWSGILLQYRCVDESTPSTMLAADDEPIILVELFNLKAGSNKSDGLKKLFLVIRGDRSLIDFQPYAVSGIEVRKAKRDFGATHVFQEHSRFEAYFRQLMGIRSAKTIELLHKTQAAKNFGSLDDLLRNFMLDKPETFAMRDEAVEQFTSLESAHKGVVDQRRQMTTLEPLEAIVENVAALRKRQHDVDELEEHLEPCTDHIVWELTCEQRSSARHDLDALDEAVDSAEADLLRNQEALARAQTIADQHGGLAIEEAQLGILTRKQQLKDVQLNRDGLLSDIASTGITELPHTRSEWEALKRQIGDQARALGEVDESKRDERRRAQGRPGFLRDRIDEVDRELRHLRKRASNIPREFDALRCALATHAGLRADELPFMGEMISVRQEFFAWQPAIERLFGRRSLTLLVPVGVAKVIAEYVESRDLGLRLEYVAVPRAVEVPDRTLSARSVPRRLEVAHFPAHPEFNQWVRRELLNRWDYECVDSTDEFPRYEMALSIHGQIKQKQRYIKDDRAPLNDRRRWYLGTDNDRKIEEYTDERTRLVSELAEAERIASAIEKSQRDAQSLAHAVRTLEERSWASYDIDSQTHELEKLEQHLVQLRKSNKDLDAATREVERCRGAVENSDALLRKLMRDLDKKQDAVHDFTQVIDELEARMANRSLPGDISQALRREFAEIDAQYRTDASRIYRISGRVRKTLGQRRAALIEEENEAINNAQLIMDRYRGMWPAPAKNLSSSFEDIDGYLGIYRQIKATGLPNHEHRFLEILRQFSQDQITLLASTIRSAFTEIAIKLEPVNASLAMAEYNPGTHLQIVMSNSRGVEATEFLTELNRISSGSFDTDSMEKAEPRFEAAAALIRRLGSKDSEDVRWQNRCLDTRLHVKFIANELSSDGQVVQVYDSDVGLSGGQKQKLVIYCLAAALRYQLAEEGRELPRYGTVVLDEAFDKADYQFAANALDIFETFGFHMVLATPFNHVRTIERHVGAVFVVECFEKRRSEVYAVSFEEIDQEEPL